jgi:hypothetical protein
MAYYGQLIINDRSVYLTKINEQRGLVNKDELFIDDNCKMHLYDGNKIILTIAESGDIYYRGVYDIKTGALINELVDNVFSENHFVRRIGNVGLTIKNNEIITVESIKVLPPIKFAPKSLKDEANPFIGS